jgi:hypothetical protein
MNIKEDLIEVIEIKDNLEKVLYRSADVQPMNYI